MRTCQFCHLVIYLFLSLFVHSHVRGQGKFGLKIGGNISRINGSFEYYKTTYRPGFQIGMSYKRLLSETIFIRPEVAITQKGGKIDYTIYGETGADYKLYGYQKVNYLELPLNVDLKLSANAKQFVYVTFGVYYAFAIGGKLILDNEFTDHDDPENSRTIHYRMQMQYKNIITTADQKKYDSSFEQENGFLKKSDAGVKIGLGYQLGIIRTDLTYCIGLRNINPHEAGVVGSEITKTNSTAELNFSIFLD